MSSFSSGSDGVEHGEEPAENPGGTDTGDVSEENRVRGREALRASFARLSPQGSDEWNFMGAFTHLGDRYGP